MAQVIADRKDIDSVLHEQFELSGLSRHEVYREFKKTTIAQERMGTKPVKKDRDFYAGQLRSALFFIGSILPVTLGKMSSILNFDGAAMEISDTSFGGR